MQVENESGGTGIIRLIDKCLDLFEMTVSALALLGMTVSVLLAIVLRYVLKVPNIAGEEISRYLLVTIVFIGISMCVRTRSHMGVTIFVDMLPACLRRVVMVIADIITTVTLGFISVLSWLYVASSLARPAVQRDDRDAHGRHLYGHGARPDAFRAAVGHALLERLSHDHPSAGCPERRR